MLLPGVYWLVHVVYRSTHVCVRQFLYPFLMAFVLIHPIFRFHDSPRPFAFGVGYVTHRPVPRGPEHADCRVQVRAFIS